MTDDDWVLPLEEPEPEPINAPREPEEEILTVGQVNRLARNALERITVTVQGEVSGLATGYRYYVYFDLRDEEASLPALLTQRQLEMLDFKLEAGMTVVARGTLSLFEKQGKYQIKISELRPFGEGDIQRRIEALKKKLQKEGLFEDARKKALPIFPERIGVVTSPRGAAVRDVVVTLRRRFPPAKVFIRGVTVQGTGAIAEICAALDFFDGEWPVDVVILARGGGSLADLEPFNSEEVARAIVRMGVPLITGIGHEPDVTVADLVADRRASTPTGAAEAAVPDRAEVRAALAKAAGSLARNAVTDINSAGQTLGSMRGRPLFRGVEFMLGPFMQRWERAATSLPESPRRGLLKGVNRLAVIESRPVFKRPGEMLSGRRSHLETRRSRLWLAGGRLIEQRAHLLHGLKARAEALSPLAVLERGYSITFEKDSGRVVRASKEVGEGAALRIRLHSGALEAEVTGKE